MDKINLEKICPLCLEKVNCKYFGKCRVSECKLNSLELCLTCLLQHQEKHFLTKEDKLILTLDEKKSIDLGNNCGMF